MQRERLDRAGCADCPLTPRLREICDQNLDRANGVRNIRSIDALPAGNIVVTADAGAGKSIVLLDAAERLRATGATVVFLNADGELPSSRTRSKTCSKCGPSPAAPPTSLIDGMDGLRLQREVRRLGKLIARLRNTPWRIAIASRAYDLAYSPGLREPHRASAHRRTDRR